MFIRILCFFALLFCSADAAVEQTLSLIKPDAVKANHIGAIIDRFEKAGLHITAARMTKLSNEEARSFYAIHRDKPFYSGLVNYMTSGPIVALVLEGENAVMLNRELMGATDPKKAKPNTLRADFAASITENAVHGSDSLENAKQEISFFFKPNEIY